MKSSSKKRLRIESSNSYNKEPPDGAEITEKNVSTTVDEIENGYIITKSYSGRYKDKDAEDDDGDNYFSYDKRWYSKENPLTITSNDKELADAFDEEE